ncbi:glycosyltransferase [Kiloniella majae]|uniref:glycosyltransferase n=1 Tax=Kiloniella majae TaxID=1938558 RepID=UPI000A278650|nr:glycosyltransferase [Kiloniella majae]
MTLILKNKRIVVTTIGTPHPEEGASVVLFYHYIKALVDQGAKVLHLISAPSASKIQDEVKVYHSALGEESDIEIKVIEGKLPIIPNRFKVSSDFSAFNQCKETVEAFRPDAGLAFDLAAAGLLNNLNLPYKTVWLGDLSFQSNWYNFLYSFKEDLKTLRWAPYALSQMLYWKRLYKKVLHTYDDIIVSSKSSEKALQKLGLVSQFAPYPWPAGQCIPEESHSSLPQIPTFLFYGNLIGLGSRSSLHFLFTKLYPLLVEQFGSEKFKILIGGREVPRHWAAQAIKEHPEIQSIGYIDNLTTCMAGCHAIIAPLDVPVGNRSRILTAWSMKALVITHINARLGNPLLVDGKTAHLASDAASFAEKMRLSVSDLKGKKSITDQAYKSYIEEYAPERASPLFVNLIKKSAS